MTLYEQWLTGAYDKNGQSIKKFWDAYMPVEQKVYENMLAAKANEIKGSVKELGVQYNMPPHHICGFLDGVKEALEEKPDIENLTEETEINTKVDFIKLYKLMVEYKAEHLYTLPQWEDIFPEDERKELYKEQKSSKTIVKPDKAGRNDPCPCGSGKKYKKCCGA